ncbi:sigma factor-like helix-turn-helix DNA-binding protein [Streptomyces canus]
MDPAPSASTALAGLIPGSSLNIEGLTESYPDQTSHLLADRELFAELKSDGFVGVRYEIFCNELAAYGRPVMRRWLITGEIYRRCAERGRPVKGWEELRELLREDTDAREQLAHDAVAAGLQHFHRHALSGGRWDPEGGASLRSYFVGAIILVFKDTHARWAREYQHRQREVLGGTGADIDTWLPLVEVGADMEGDVVGEDIVTDFLSTLEETNRRIVELRIEGHGPAEIASRLAMPADRVRTRLYRLRRALRGSQLWEEAQS